MFGKIVCDLTPSKVNNRNSEGSFIKLKNGNLLFAYTRYGSGGCDDQCVADIYGIISEDEDESFGKPFLIFSCKDLNADNVMSVSLIRMKNGDIGLFYLQKHNKFHNCIPYLTTSSDEGKTWNEHRRCIDEDGYFVLNNDRVITLNNGRILMPVAKHSFEGDVFLPGSIYMYASDDNGITWNRLSEEIKINPFNNFRKNFNALHNSMEPGIIQLENGTVWCYIRTELGRQYETFSEDFGVTWSVPHPSPFTSSDSPMCVKKLKNGKLFAVWNPIPIHNGKATVINGVWTGARTPLVCALLNKEANFENNCKIIESDKESGFCYCAIYETEKGDILLGYCAGGLEDKQCLNRLRIRKIYRNEIL